MVLSRSVFLRLLLNQRAHNKNVKRVAAVFRNSSVEQVSRKEHLQAWSSFPERAALLRERAKTSL
jgi:hypothetical protein